MSWDLAVVRVKREDVGGRGNKYPKGYSVRIYNLGLLIEKWRFSNDLPVQNCQPIRKKKINTDILILGSIQICSHY